MTNERPRPQYGEYATPEQQVAAGGLPKPQALPEPPQPIGAAPLASAQADAAPKPRRWDRIVSIALLAYGLYSVIVGVVQFRDVSGVLNQVYELQGVGTFTPTTLSSALGIVIVVSQVVLYLVTLLITMSLLRRGRLAFWVPLVGGLVAGVILSVCILVVMATDPTFIAYVNEMSAAQ